MIVYELWDSRSNNLIDAYDSESEALHAVARAIREQGESVVEPLELLWDDEEQDEYGIVAVGQALIERAKSVA